MSESPTFTASIEFSKEEKTAANQEIIERVTRILFVIFMPDERSLTDSEVEELLDDCFGMASVLMGVAGMDIIGFNNAGDYVARFKPYKSLEHFGKERGI